MIVGTKGFDADTIHRLRLNSDRKSAFAACPVTCGRAATGFRTALLLITALLSLLPGCGGADAPLREKQVSLQINTVDENNDAFKVQTVRWWYFQQRNRRHELKCEVDRCAHWVIEGEISGPIVVQADASIVHGNDAHCWDLYAGEAVVEPPAEEVTIAVLFTGTVCT
ncbi:MAG TPA: hypothetical protein PLZ16_08115 [Gammaproteobacteria bacterium]|mgnify:CR=1 FL=1|nr:hypothetical protein [Gammaproteobacteria bacterium]